MSRIITNNLRHNDASSDNLTLDGTGNITAPGNLSVTGTSTLTGNVSASGNLNVTGTSTLTDDLVVDTDTLFVDASTDRVGLGTASPAAKFHVKLNTNENIHFLSYGSGDQRINARNDANNANVDLTIESNSLIFRRSGGTESARFTSSGGLTFNGDTAAANALDDYEEGTWSPNYSFGGTAHTNTVSAGTYIKTGGMVFVTGYLYTNNSSTYSGTATITGLPFSIPSGLRYRGAFAIGQIQRFNEDMPNIKLYPGDNGSTISMFRQATNSNGVTELTNAQFNFQSEFNILTFSGSYPVA